VVASASRQAPLSTALAIFVKTPGLSPIKTRLAQVIGAAAAEEFHRRAAAAIAAVVRAAVAEGVELTPYWAVAEAAALGHPDWTQFPALWQGRGELADRLGQVHDALRAQHDQVVMIGADAPQISSALLAAALTALHDPATPFALGRARDGGFWLFGSRAEIPRQVWRSVHYSDSRTADQLSAALGALGSIACLPELTDVDTVDDLPYLQSELAALIAPLPEQSQVGAWIEGLSARIHKGS
jgi:rSAM/selenodomain-associated transferase 1